MRKGLFYCIGVFMHFMRKCCNDSMIAGFMDSVKGIWVVNNDMHFRPRSIDSLNPLLRKGLSCATVFILMIMILSLIQAIPAQDAFCDIIPMRLIWVRGGDGDSNLTLKNPTGFCIDTESQRVYIADTGNNRIVVISPDGKKIEHYLTSKRIEKPFDIIYGPDGLFYISQLNEAKIDVFDKGGIYVTSVPKGEDSADLRPGRMAFDPNGLLLFGDRVNGEIYILNREGYVSVRIKDEREDGLLMGLYMDGNGKIFTAWADGTPVRIFRSNGDMPFSFGHYRQIESGFSFLTSITLDKKGYIWVTDTFRHSVKVFDQRGGYLFRCDIKDLAFPIDLEFDMNGRIYILEKGEGRIRAFWAGS